MEAILGSMSFVKEYSCQYTDQIQRKHKSWHDGKLKYSSKNSRFTLYSIEETPKILTNAFVTSSKDVHKYLSPQGFNLDEHQIFGRYLIIINERIGENKNEVESRSPVQGGNETVPVLTGSANANLPVKFRRTGDDPLALKMNRRFVPPRLLKMQPANKKVLNRPSVRKPRLIESKGIKEREKIRKIKHEPISLSVENSFNDIASVRICHE